MINVTFFSHVLRQQLSAKGEFCHVKSALESSWYSSLPKVSTVSEVTLHHRCDDPQAPDLASEPRCDHRRRAGSVRTMSNREHLPPAGH